MSPTLASAAMLSTRTGGMYHWMNGGEVGSWMTFLDGLLLDRATWRCCLQWPSAWRERPPTEPKSHA